MYEYSSLIHVMVSKHGWMVVAGVVSCWGGPLFCAGREKHATKCLHVFQTLDGDDLCRT